MSEVETGSCHGFFEWLFIVLGTILAVFGGVIIELWNHIAWFFTDYLYIVSFFMGIGLGYIFGRCK